MKSVALDSLSIDELVARFAELGLRQDLALLYGRVAEFNRLFREMSAVRLELNVRPGDQRRALMALFNHENSQVRLQAARMSWAVAPKEARAVVEAIAKSKKYPQAGDAGMSLWRIDEEGHVPK